MAPIQTNIEKFMRCFVGLGSSQGIEQMGEALKQSPLRDSLGSFCDNAQHLAHAGFVLFKALKTVKLRPTAECGLEDKVASIPLELVFLRSWVIIGAWNSQHDDALNAGAETPVADKTHIGTGSAPSTSMEKDEITVSKGLASCIK